LKGYAGGLNIIDIIINVISKMSLLLSIINTTFLFVLFYDLTMYPLELSLLGTNIARVSGLLLGPAPSCPWQDCCTRLKLLYVPIALTKSRSLVQATGETSLKAAELMTGLPGSSLGSANQQLCTMQAWSTDETLRKACMEAALKGYAMRLVCRKLTTCLCLDSG
jgi:hypothetical protein